MTSKLKFYFYIFISVGLLSAFFSFAQTPSSDFQSLIQQLQAQIKLLQNQVLELKSQLEVTKKETTATKEELKTTKEEVKAISEELKLTRFLRKGESGEEVRKLQEFLSQFPDIYPEGLITGFFGARTEAAIKKLQEKHGIETVGNVGPKTLAKINELLNEGAGKSGVIPPGLLTAPGIQRKMATETTEFILPVTPANASSSLATTTNLGTSTIFTTIATSTIPATSTTPAASSGQTTSTTPPANTTTQTTTTAGSSSSSITNVGTTTTATSASPDLTILGFQSPTAATVGQSVTLKVQVRNAGPGTAPISKLLLAFSQTSNYDVNTQFYKDVIAETRTTLDVPQIIPSSPDAERAQSNTAWVEWHTTIPQTTLSSIYFVAKSDPDNLIVETSESDNSGGTQINVSQPVILLPAPTNVQVVTTSGSQSQPPQMWYYMVFNYTLQSTTQSFNVYRKRPTDASFVKYTYGAQTSVNASILPLPGSDESNLYHRETNQWEWWTTLPAPAPNSAAGEYKFYVTAVDTNGVEGSPSDTKSFKLYAAPTISSPIDGSTVSITPTITVSGDPSAPSPTYGMALYKKTTGDTAWVAWPAPSTSFTYSGTTLNPSDNPHRLVVWFTSGTYNRSLFATSIFNVSTTTSYLDLRAKNLAAISQSLEEIRKKLLTLMQGL